METLKEQQRRLGGVLVRHLAVDLVRWVLALARPAFRLVPCAEMESGEGVRPVRLARPGGAGAHSAADGSARGVLLGTVDYTALAGLRRCPDLPRYGLGAFHLVRSTTSTHRGEPADRGSVTRVDGEHVPAPEVGCEAVAFLSLPHPLDPVLRALDRRLVGSLAVYEPLYRAWIGHIWADGAARHQLGGWPHLVNGPLPPPPPPPPPMTRTRGTSLRRPPPAARPLSPKHRPHSAGDRRGGRPAERLRLLAQFDSDPDLDWHWGEPGRLLFTLERGERMTRARLTAQSTLPSRTRRPHTWAC